ncbi:MAG: 3-hydroxybutyryl-CoA dehydrogenase [Sphingobacteriia bacterium]|nr:3-hydroxybutyryl-CoA dehydrogenase [Sphingobacteriia bacterium]
MISAYEKIAVIGAGTMGNGIAHVFAQAGYSVHLIDVSPESLTKALATIGGNIDRQIKKEVLTSADKDRILGAIHTHTTLAEGVEGCALVIEAATENVELKLKIFKELDTLCGRDTILATNTSSISISLIGSVTQRSSQVIGMHFMNPVPVMKLVEIIRGYNTSDTVLQAIVALTQDLGKTPEMSEDYPGFVANRILMPMINEAIWTLHEGVATREAIDSVMRLGMAHPMGPLQLADFIGLDVCLAILRVLHDGFGNPKYAPCPLLVNMVTAGHLGKKSNKGFYSYM